MRKLLIVAGILLAAFLVYLPELRYALVYDDYPQLISNPRLTMWSYVPGYFTTHLWAHSSRIAAIYYRPLFLLWFRVVYALLGPPAPIWHLPSVLAHVIATGCVFALLRRLTGNFQGAALGTLLFAIDPIHTEPVAWVSSCGDLLLTILVVLCVYFYAKRQGPVSWLAMLFALLAMFTKEIGIVAPVLLFAYEWTYSGFQSAVSKAPPYALSAVLYMAFRMNALGSAVTGAPAEMSFTAMVLNWPRVLAAYARHLIWPVHLSLSYDVSGGSFLWPLMLTLAVVAGLVWLLRDNDATIRFGAAWVAITLAPALAIRYITWDDYVHDRYLYLPSVGLALIAAVWLGRVRFTVPRAIAACALGVVLCWGTRLNLRVWQDGVPLFTRAMETAPRNVIVKNNLAEAYLTAQRPGEAFPLLQELLRDYPDFDLANRNMARYYWEIGDVKKANRYRELSRRPGQR